MDPSTPTTTTAPAATPLRVLIVEDDTLVGLGLKSTLQRLGHHVTAHAATPADALASFSSTPPDLVLLDIRLGPSDNPAEDGIDLASRLSSVRRGVPMIIISAYSDPELVRRATAAGVFGYLVKPVTAETLSAQIEVAVTRSEEHESLLQQNASLAQQLETRKLVEKAKGVLMKRLNLSEPDAHRRLQLESQKRRLPLADMAKKILESDDLLSS
jgi:response regulator NasT